MTTTIDYALMAGASYISTRPDLNRIKVNRIKGARIELFSNIGQS